MDVERIQKINNLALDLMKQGLAETREEAIAQAERVFHGREAEEYTKLRDTIQEVKAEAEPVVREAMGTAPEPVQGEELSQDQIKHILEQNSKFIVKKFTEFSDKVTTLEREMAELRTKMTYNRLPTVEDVRKESTEPVASPIETEVSTVQEAAQPKPQKVDQSNEKVPENHPRSGGYNDEDVSIEKFFYMGSK